MSARYFGLFSCLMFAAGMRVDASPSPSPPGYIGGVEKFVGSRCNTEKAPPRLLDDARRMNTSTLSLDAEDENINIKTYVHVVTTTASRYNFTQQMVDNQMVAMNDAYNPFSISYELVTTSYTVNDEWATASTDDAEKAMKTALRRGTYADLNLYFLSDLGGGLLGFCYFPDAVDGSGANGNDTLILDGCVNVAGSLPGGLVEDYNEGKTAVHEAGHWHGVMHVFQGDSCDGPGDYVDDTPMQKNQTWGCPASADSCPDVEGEDNVHNFMDYSNDACMSNFTLGQGQRMLHSYKTYRAGK